jgi:hypothetical protein
VFDVTPLEGPLRLGSKLGKYQRFAVPIGTANSVEQWPQKTSAGEIVDCVCGLDDVGQVSTECRRSVQF